MAAPTIRASVSSAHIVNSQHKTPDIAKGGCVINRAIANPVKSSKSAVGVSMTNDPRTIANIILDKCDVRKIPVNIHKLVSLLYLCHCWHLTVKNEPLIAPGFSAWSLGPTSRLVMGSFAAHHCLPIDFRAGRTIIETGKTIPCYFPISEDAEQTINDTLDIYGECSWKTLKEINKSDGSPWHQIWVVEKNKVNLGLKISDEIIREKFSPLKNLFNQKSKKILTKPRFKE